MLNRAHMNHFERVLFFNFVFAPPLLLILRSTDRDSHVFAVTIYFCWFVLGLFVIQHSCFALLVWNFTAALTPRAHAVFRGEIEKKQIQKSLSPFLLRILLSLKVGRGLRESLSVESQLEDSKLGVEIQKFAVAIEKQQKFDHEDPRLRQMYDLFALLDREPAKIVTRIEVFRKKIECEDHFRAKVAQILSQPRAQASIVGLLYVSLILFLHFNFQISDWLTYFYLSLPPFILGQAFLFRMGRNYRWKV